MELGYMGRPGLGRQSWAEEAELELALQREWAR